MIRIPIAICLNEADFRLAFPALLKAALPIVNEDGTPSWDNCGDANALAALLPAVLARNGALESFSLRVCREGFSSTEASEVLLKGLEALQAPAHALDLSGMYLSPAGDHRTRARTALVAPFYATRCQNPNPKTHVFTFVLQASRLP